MSKNKDTRNDTGRVAGFNYTMKAEKIDRDFREQVAKQRSQYKEDKSLYRRLVEYFFGEKATQSTYGIPQEATMNLDRRLKQENYSEHQRKKIMDAVKGKPPKPDLKDDDLEYILETFGIEGGKLKDDELYLLSQKEIDLEPTDHFDFLYQKGGWKKPRRFIVMSIKKNEDETYGIHIKSVEGRKINL